jgi:hypothetical protein
VVVDRGVTWPQLPQLCKVCRQSLKASFGTPVIRSFASSGSTEAGAAT